MAKITFDRIMPLLVKQERSDGLAGLLRDILVLQDKLNNLDQQSFYFRMGRDNHAANLGGMKQEYAELVAKINKYPVAYFEAKLRKVEDKHRYYSDDKNWQSSRFIRGILLGSLSSEIKYYKEMIDIKQRFGTLKPLRQLLKDEEALRAIFE